MINPNINVTKKRRPEFCPMVSTSGSDSTVS